MNGLSDPIRSLTLDSGGGYRVFVTDQDATAAMRHVAEELHHQYLLGFTPTTLDGKVHKVEVTTTRGHTSVHARKTYLAAPQ